MDAAATQTIPRSRSNVEIIVIIIGPDTTDRQICQLFSTSSVEDQIFLDDCGWVYNNHTDINFKNQEKVYVLYWKPNQ